MNKLYSIILGLFCLTTFTVGAASVTLSWDASCDPSVVNYKIYYGTNTTLSTNIVAAYTDECSVFHPRATNIYHLPYTLSAPSSGGRTNCTLTISNLLAGITYSFAATALDSSGLESDYSNETRYTAPNVVIPPSKLKFP